MRQINRTTVRAWRGIGSVRSNEPEMEDAHAIAVRNPPAGSMDGKAISLRSDPGGGSDAIPGNSLAEVIEKS